MIGQFGPVPPAVVRVIQTGIEPETGLAGGAVGAFLTTLVVGAILVAVAPGYTERTMESVAEDPIGSFVYGLVFLGGLVILTILLAITIVGIFVIVPLVLAAVVVWGIGAAIAYLAIADRLVGREEGWPKPLVVAAALNGALALTGIGGIVSFAIGAAGFGAVLRGMMG